MLEVEKIKSYEIGILSKINSKYLCGAFNQDDCLVGAADGSLQIY